MNPSLHTDPQRKSRIIPFDLLRILASFGVVVLHVTPLPEALGGVSSPRWQTAVCVSILFRWCVPVFFMISGALFLSPDRAFSMRRLYRRTIARIGISFLFWSAVYALIHCLRTGKGKWTFLNQFLRGHFHMWYLFAILALYLLTPLIREMTKSRKATAYFLTLSFAFTFLIPRLFSVLFLFSLPHEDVFLSLRSAMAQINPLSGMLSLYYFVLGHYLSTCTLGRLPRRLLYAAGAAGYALSCMLTVRHSASIGEISGQFYDISSLSALAMAAAVFVFFQQHFSALKPGKRAAIVISELSACAFGVYLLHPMVIDLLKPVLPQSPVLLPAAQAGIALCVYLLSLSLCALLRRIPVLGKNIL